MAAFSYKNKKGDTYFLHERRSKTSTGKERVIYFFSREQKEGAIDQLPAAYQVAETATGLPVLKKK